MHDRICSICGKPFNAVHCEIYCSDECRKIGTERYAKERRDLLWNHEVKAEKPKEKPKLSIGEIAVLARKEGLTYGQYIVKHKL